MDRIELQTLNDSITARVCIGQCGSKCCNLKENDIHVKVSLQDYSRLYHHGVQEFVTFQGMEDYPQLLPRVDGTCIFLHPESKSCTIHDIKPVHCRKYPFNTEKEIPKYCDLFHLSTYNLKDEMSDKEFSEVHSSVTNEVRERYQDNKRHGDLSVQSQITESIEISHNQEYWIIYLSDSIANEDNLESVIDETITKLKEHMETEWSIFSVRVYSENATFQFQVNGIVTSEDLEQIPYVSNIPPLSENLYKLLLHVSNHQTMQRYLIAGVDLPNSAYQVIANI